MLHAKLQQLSRLQMNRKYQKQDNLDKTKDIIIKMKKSWKYRVYTSELSMNTEDVKKIEE